MYKRKADLPWKDHLKTELVEACLLMGNVLKTQDKVIEDLVAEKQALIAELMKTRIRAAQSSGYLKRVERQDAMDNAGTQVEVVKGTGGRDGYGNTYPAARELKTTRKVFTNQERVIFDEHTFMEKAGMGFSEEEGMPEYWWQTRRA